MKIRLTIVFICGVLLTLNAQEIPSDCPTTKLTEPFPFNCSSPQYSEFVNMRYIDVEDITSCCASVMSSNPNYFDISLNQNVPNQVLEEYGNYACREMNCHGFVQGNNAIIDQGAYGVEKRYTTRQYLQVNSEADAIFILKDHHASTSNEPFNSTDMDHLRINGKAKAVAHYNIDHSAIITGDYQIYYSKWQLGIAARHYYNNCPFQGNYNSFRFFVNRCIVDCSKRSHTSKLTASSRNWLLQNEASPCYVEPPCLGPQLPRPDFVAAPTPICMGGIQGWSVAPIIGAEEYIWSSTGNLHISSYGNSAVLEGTSYGSGTISVKAKNCNYESPVATLNYSVINCNGNSGGSLGGGKGLRVKNNNKELKLYPNPVGDILNIELSDEDEIYDIVIQNALGQSVKRIKLTGGLNQVDTNEMRSGLYLVSVKGEHATTWTTKKFLKI